MKLFPLFTPCICLTLCMHEWKGKADITFCNFCFEYSFCWESLVISVLGIFAWFRHTCKPAMPLQMQEYLENIAESLSVTERNIVRNLSVSWSTYYNLEGESQHLMLLFYIKQYYLSLQVIIIEVFLLCLKFWSLFICQISVGILVRHTCF